MIKNEKIQSVGKPEDLVRIDNLFSTLFAGAQDKEHSYRVFTGAGVWPAAEVIGEKRLVLCNNTTDAEVRLYTKIAGNLKYLTFT